MAVGITRAALDAIRTVADPEVHALRPVDGKVLDAVDGGVRFTVVDVDWAP